MPSIDVKAEQACRFVSDWTVFLHRNVMLMKSPKKAAAMIENAKIER